MRLAADIVLYVFAANGLRVTIGLPPIMRWFKREAQPASEKPA